MVALVVSRREKGKTCCLLLLLQELKIADDLLNKNPNNENGKWFFSCWIKIWCLYKHSFFPEVLCSRSEDLLLKSVVWVDNYCWRFAEQKPKQWKWEMVFFVLDKDVMSVQTLLFFRSSLLKEWRFVVEKCRLSWQLLRTICWTKTQTMKMGNVFCWIKIWCLYKLFSFFRSSLFKKWRFVVEISVGWMVIE